MKRHRDEDELPMSRVKPVDDDVRGEVEFHIEQRAAELVAQGETPERAQQMARALFGDRPAVESECREIESRRRDARRRARRLEALRQDVTVGLRILRKSPGFTVAAMLTLALGIGANTAVFSIVKRVLLDALPYAHADRLVTMVERNEQGTSSVTWANFLDIEAQARSFDAMASYGAFPTTVIGAGTATRVRVAVHSRGFFHVFPVRPIVGRLPLPDEYRLGANPVAVVSDEFWRDRLGSPRSLDGIRVKVNRDYDVVGVLPPGFDFPGKTQVWFPMELESQSMSRSSHNWDVIAMLKAGVAPLTAQGEVDAILARLKPRYFPDFDATGSRLTPLQEQMTSTARKPLYLLLAASALLLIGACTNLAGAMLARGTARSGEIALRSALGATRPRLVRQLLTESALVALLGCAGGLVLAKLVLGILGAFAPSSIDLATVRIDGWVLGFAVLVAAVTTLFIGLMPALRLSAGGMSTLLREGSRGTAETGRIRLWNVLVGAEVALTVVLLSSSALLIESFARVLSTKLGFEPEHVVAARVDLPAVNYGDTSAAVAQFHTRVLEKLRATPGVSAVGFANLLPVAGSGPSGSLQMEDKPVPKESQGGNGYAYYRVIGGDFFTAMGIPLVRGRTLADGDDRSAAPVVVISQTFATKEWPGEEVLGKRLRPAGMDFAGNVEPWWTVVGVVGDSRIRSVTDPFQPIYYFDYRQRPAYRSRSVTYAVRTSMDVSAMVGILQRTIASVDPLVPLEVLPADRIVANSTADRRFTVIVLGAFAVVALFLAIIGIYAVVSYSVARRTREIGVRIALGGTPAAMHGLVLRSSMAPVSVGLALGVVLALTSANLLRSLLYEISPFNALALLAAVVLLLLSALASITLPAMRATRVHPMIAMRAE